MKKIIKYRADIDGLRAIAVLGVILYHSEIAIGNINIFSGGFLGVDVFFVISGYLITSIILKEYSLTKKFSFFNFYEKRIRRLVPVLLFIILISLIFSYLFLLPVQFNKYINSIFSSIFFYSNFYFHFSGQSYGQSIFLSHPLIHTWSLSVEEQFYILYPILLIFFISIFKKKIKFVFCIFIFLSIVFTSYMSEHHSSFNFYMLTSRAWELASGALIAIYQSQNEKIKVRSYLKPLGFILIIFSFFYFENTSKHPSYLTLVPVLGTCMIILNFKSKNLTDKILTNKHLVRVGLISYSLYLWHYPILSFGKISGITENLLISKIILIIFSFFVSYLTYIYIEKFFRNNKNISFKKLFIIILSIIILLALSKNFFLDKHIKRYPKILHELYDQRWNVTKQYYKTCFQRKSFFCYFGNDKNQKTTFLIGDSILASMQEELKNNLLKRDINFIPMTNAGCDFIIPTKITKFCNRNIQLNRHNKISQFEDAIIILHLNYKNLRNNSLEISSFINNIKKYLDSGYSIIVIYPIPQWNESVSREIYDTYKNINKNFLIQINNFDTISLDEDFYSLTIKINEKLDALSHENLFFIYPKKIFCNNDKNNKCLAHSPNEIYFTDQDHLSKTGSEILNTELIKIIDKIK